MYSRLNVSDDVLLIEVPRRGHQRRVRLNREVELTLVRAYPDLNPLLNLFPGEVYCAGGCLYRAIWSHNMDSDCDLFFVNCTKKRIDEILRNVYHFFVGRHGQEQVICARNQNTTTFSIWADRNEYGEPEEDATDAESLEHGLKYQFIHGRSYPSKEAIVVGFDLGASALLYDGHEISATPLGIFCVSLSVNILDPSRRSTTYEHRILKYATLGVNLISTCAFKSDLQAHYGTQHMRGYCKRHELVKGLMIKIRRDCFELCPYAKDQALSDKSDYGAIATSLYYLHVANAKLAFSGKYDQIMWSGRDIESIFDHPVIRYSLGSAFENYVTAQSSNDAIHDGAEVADVSRSCGDKRLSNWVGKKTVDEIIATKYDGKWPPKYLPFEDYCHLIPDIRARAQVGISIAQEMATKGVSYIGPQENPGRQFTASFNPVYSNVRDYYGPRAQILKIGIPDEVYFVVKCAIKAVLGVYYKDPIRLIMRSLTRLMCDDVLNILLTNHKPPKAAFGPKSTKKRPTVKTARNAVRKALQESDDE